MPGSPDDHGRCGSVVKRVSLIRANSLGIIPERNRNDGEKMCSWVGHSPDHMRRRRRPRQPFEGANFHAAPPRRSFIFRPGLDCVLIGAWRYRKELAPTIETRTKLALALASKCISRPGAHRLRITILMAMAYGDATVTARSLKYQTTLATGAPRPTKMGTIVSPWRYDATA